MFSLFPGLTPSKQLLAPTGRIAKRTPVLSGACAFLACGAVLGSWPQNATADSVPQKARSTVELTPAENLAVHVTSDHIEAGEIETSNVTVHLQQGDGTPRVGVAISLSTTAGTLAQSSMITDANGNGAVDTNGNGTIEEGEPRQVVLTSPRHGAFGVVTAEGGDEVGTKRVLFHEVTLEDFSQPRLIAYNPDSEDADLADPSITFTIGDVPQVAIDFNVTLSISTLDDSTPWVTKTFQNLPPGTYTKKMSDFVFLSGQEPNDRVPSPGEGLYPFQIDVQVSHAGAAPGIDSTSCAHSNWKASKSLTVKASDQLQGGYSLEYDEEEDKTYLTYMADVTNTNRPAAPAVARVDVYDPDFALVGSVPIFSPPTQHIDDPNTFLYTFRGPVTIDKAGEYHFVVEVREDDTKEEGKDRQKWAMERNSSSNVPTYVTFGGESPGISDPGLPGGLEKVTGGVLDMRSVSGAAASRIQKMGYRVNIPNRNPWWATNYRGVYRDGFQTAEDVVGLGAGSLTKYTNGDFNYRTQPVQYNAVWLYSGHGGSGHVMAVWNPGAGKSSKGTYGWDQPDWTYMTSNGNYPVGANTTGSISLTGLPVAAKGYYLNHVWHLRGTVAPLTYVRLACFLGCETYTGATDDLPHKAVSLGARNAVGVTVCLTAPQMQTLAETFFDRLAAGDTVAAAADAASIAQSNGSSHYILRAAGPTLNSGLVGAQWGWGDGKGPEGE